MLSRGCSKASHLSLKARRSKRRSFACEPHPKLIGHWTRSGHRKCRPRPYRPTKPRPHLACPIPEPRAGSRHCARASNLPRWRGPRAPVAARPRARRAVGRKATRRPLRGHGARRGATRRSLRAGRRALVRRARGGANGKSALIRAPRTRARETRDARTVHKASGVRVARRRRRERLNRARRGGGGRHRHGNRGAARAASWRASRLERDRDRLLRVELGEAAVATAAGAICGRAVLGELAPAVRDRVEHAVRVLAARPDREQVAAQARALRVDVPDRRGGEAREKRGWTTGSSHQIAGRRGSAAMPSSTSSSKSSSSKSSSGPTIIVPTDRPRPR